MWGLPSPADLTSLLSYEWIEIETVACLVKSYGTRSLSSDEGIHLVHAVFIGCANCFRE